MDKQNPISSIIWNDFRKKVNFLPPSLTWYMLQQLIILRSVNNCSLIRNVLLVIFNPIYKMIT